MPMPSTDPVSEPDLDTVPFDPAALPPMDAYQLLVHAVAPRPVAWVSSQAADGTRNLAPFSYFTAGGHNPPSVVISPCTPEATSSRVSPAPGSEAAKDTLGNIRATGEYVINLADRPLAAPMTDTAAGFPPEVSEWEAVGVPSVASVRVAPPRVAGAIFALECRLHRIVPHGDGPGAANYVIGEVIYAHAARRLFAGEQRHAAALDSARVGSIGRLGGDWYADCRGEALFTLDRPRSSGS